MTVVVTSRSEFMVHAYQALLTQQIFEMSDDLRSVMLMQITDDVCTAMRTLPKDAQNEFLDHVRKRIREPH